MVRAIVSADSKFGRACSGGPVASSTSPIVLSTVASPLLMPSSRYSSRARCRLAEATGKSGRQLQRTEFAERVGFARPVAGVAAQLQRRQAMFGGAG